MLTHQHAQPQKPERVVILGSGGFVGSHLLRALTNDDIEVLELPRTELDLLGEGAAAKLAWQLQSTDTLVFISAKAPVKNTGMLLENLRMGEAVCEALRNKPVRHLVYVSSDAVYKDSMEPLTEESCAEPGSLHGVMHLAREVMLRSELPDLPLACVRPTLIYGANDPHNGYGPNRYRRLAAMGEKIVLFGEGEERRDHVYIEDVAGLIHRTILHGSTGVLNAVSGTVTSFRDVAEAVVGLFEKPVPIEGSPRSGPMPHNGYRPFDNNATAKAFPDFQYHSLADGLQKSHDNMREGEK